MRANKRHRAGSVVQADAALPIPITEERRSATSAKTDVAVRNAAAGTVQAQAQAETDLDRVDDSKSLELSKVFLILAISELCYGRDLFVDKCFGPCEVRAGDRNLSYQHLMDSTQDLRTERTRHGFVCLRRGGTSDCNLFLDAIEYGAFRLMNDKQLHGIVLRIFEDQENPNHVLEKHHISLDYDPTSLLAGPQLVRPPATLGRVLDRLSEAIYGFMRISHTFRSLPRKKYIDITLIHSLSDPNQPKGFKGMLNEDIDYLTVNDHANLRSLDSLLSFSTGKLDLTLTTTTIKHADDENNRSSNLRHKVPVPMPQWPLMRASKRRFRDSGHELDERGLSQGEVDIFSQVHRDTRLAREFESMTLPLAPGTQSTEANLLSSSMPAQSTPVTGFNTSSHPVIHETPPPAAHTRLDESSGPPLPSFRTPAKAHQAKPAPSGVPADPLNPKVLGKIRGPSGKALGGIGVARDSSLLSCRVGKALSLNIAGLRKPVEPSTDIINKSEGTIAKVYEVVHGEAWTAKRPADEEVSQAPRAKKASKTRARRIPAPTRRSERKKA